MKCSCRNYAAGADMFIGGILHWHWWMNARDPDAHHPSCERYDAAKQLFYVEQFLERNALRIRDKRLKIEAKRTALLVRRRGLKLV